MTVDEALATLRTVIEWRRDDAPPGPAACEEYDSSMAALETLRKAVRG